MTEARLLRRARQLPPERLVGVALSLLGLVALIATYTGAPLTWDGASLLFAILDTESPYMPHGRYSVALLQVPTLLLQRGTENVRALELLFSATYAAVPPLAALASWRIVRERNPRLVVWPILWLSIGALFGQMFFVTESLLLLAVGWPLLLTVLTGFSPLRVAVAALLSAFLFDLHPASGPLFLLFSAAAVALGVQDSARRRGLLVAALLLASFGLARIWVSLHDAYELSQARVDFRSMFRSLRLPPVAVVAAISVPTCLVVAMVVRPPRGQPLYGVIAAMLVVLALTMVRYGNSPKLWQDGLNFRFLAPFAAAGFFVGAAVVAVTTTALNDRLIRKDALVALGAAAVCLVVLSVECRRWLGFRRTLETTLEPSRRCLSMNGIFACRGTALKWWSTPSYALVVQGHTPPSLLLPGADCQQKTLDRVIFVNPWYARPRTIGWFDLRDSGRPKH